MASTATPRRGRPAAASREAALALTRARFLAGQRIDVQAIARELGLARATMHRWFGTRELLLGEMLAKLGHERLIALRAGVGGSGPLALLKSFDAFNRELAGNTGLRALVVQEPELAVRVLTAGEGVVQPEIVATVQALIDAEVQGGYRPPVESDLLAYTIVRLAEAFLYSDAAGGFAGDTRKLRRVEAALLGLDASDADN
jgi:AcrR family transcriptional regulator